MFTSLLRVAAFLSVNAMAVSGAFIPDFRVRPDDYTVLMAADAKRPPELMPFQAGAHGKFHVTGWTQPEQALEWEITVPEEDAYLISVLLRRHGSQALRVEVTGATQTVRAGCQLYPTKTQCPIPVPSFTIQIMYAYIAIHPR